MKPALDLTPASTRDPEIDNFNFFPPLLRHSNKFQFQKQSTLQLKCNKIN